MVRIGLKCNQAENPTTTKGEMLIPLAVLLTSSAHSPVSEPRAPTPATVNIRRGGVINAVRWKPAENPSQRQVTYIEADGRTIVLRLTEFE